ncbi:MAG: collagen-like protein, partial [Polyangiaceae bacterium]|nr:collagen-like protein [Polyangiaceae bacterium]
MRKNLIRRLFASSAAAASALLIASAASAAVPATITHQGRLFSSDNAPVDATLDVTFTVYDGPDDGAAVLWSETHSVTFENGYFSVELGSVKAFGADVFNGSVRHLGIQVGNDEEMKPRAAVRSVPYALLANDVNGDINPHSVSVQGFGVVIDETGKWVGDPTGLQGPMGPEGLQGPAGAIGPTGAEG